ncbi:hypothetical protein [Sphingobacterium haloxyli]|uniref:Right handed beta helix domain-containing protein n=1 Tax=Sphingobacterium haloxyli TaxID=2100533 RepID=A0A2S9J1Q3_9SPHI|nr:hypothetical protein [Sphingobacterium haloxyli]PRD46716.1 hypothetical protein C5745_14015 [Sphingobacterium haloxyli]
MMKKVLHPWIMMLTVIAVITACGKDDPAPANRDDDDDDKPDTELPEGSISGNLAEIQLTSGESYTVVGDLTVPEGESVTIPAGTTFEFELGPRNEAWVIDVHGSLYIEGTANNRVVFTASEDALASSRNRGYGGLWGGIFAGRKAGDLVIEYADILHAGGIARAGTIMTTEESGGSGRLSAGDVSYAMYYCRPDGERQDGVFVLLHSRIAFTGDDAIRTNGGKTLMAYNTFEVIGQTGGEAVNIKAGGSGDYAFNLFYNIATNALKSADTQSGERGALETNFYNNTIVSSGYRRVDPGRGGSLNYESDAFGKAFNNLIVNCRYGLRLNKGESEPRYNALEFGHNWYYGQVSEVTDNFYPTNPTDPSIGLIGTDLPIPSSDRIGAAGENAPGFVNFNIASFTWANRVNNDPMPSGADFRLQTGSAALTAGTSEFEPKFETYTTLAGKVYEAPMPETYVGAFGTE